MHFCALFLRCFCASKFGRFCAVLRCESEISRILRCFARFAQISHFALFCAFFRSAKISHFALFCAFFLRKNFAFCAVLRVFLRKNFAFCAVLRVFSAQKFCILRCFARFPCAKILHFALFCAFFLRKNFAFCAVLRVFLNSDIKKITAWQVVIFFRKNFNYILEPFKVELVGQ